MDAIAKLDSAVARIFKAWIDEPLQWKPSSGI
jgi:hypothetical protein